MTSSRFQTPISPRDRRLAADYEGIRALLRESTILEAEARGQPPQQYRFRFVGWGVRMNSQGLIVPTDAHEVAVELGAAYPRMMPTIVWKSSIFHPNISHNGVVCLGGYGTHWVPSLTLSQLCVMLWDIVRYKNFDTESPYNREAAHWAKTQTDFQFPLDPRVLRDRVSSAHDRGSAANSSDDGSRCPRNQPVSSRPALQEITFL